MTFSAQEEIRRIAALDLTGSPTPTGDGTDVSLEAWDEIVKSLARLSKEQWRANQQAELLAQQTREALAEAVHGAAAFREQADELRRENAKLREDARATATRVLALIDSLDDVGVLARQRGDAQWLKYVDRLTADSVAMLQSIGITEIPAIARPFDPEEHEALDTVERRDNGGQFEVVEVVQRGFRYHGRVLRRARVITTR